MQVRVRDGSRRHRWLLRHPRRSGAGRGHLTAAPSLMRPQERIERAEDLQREAEERGRFLAAASLGEMRARLVELGRELQLTDRELAEQALALSEGGEDEDGDADDGRDYA
eukprot:scaffold126_cov266-Prasinococcus_capsulatus_cf.AAC.1